MITHELIEKEKAVFAHVRGILEQAGGEYAQCGYFPFRKRSDHIFRVFRWAERLREPDANLDAAGNAPVAFDAAALRIAALVHDVGYAAEDTGVPHAHRSEALCRTFLPSFGYDEAFVERVAFLVRHHSDKHLLKVPETPLALVLLMEADLLDESGAMSVVWDCLMEGAKPVQTFALAHRHILEKSAGHLSEDVVVTPRARQYWDEKRQLVTQFLAHLETDLAFDAPWHPETVSG